MCHILGGLGQPVGQARPCSKVGVGEGGAIAEHCLYPCCHRVSWLQGVGQHRRWQVGVEEGAEPYWRAGVGKGPERLTGAWRQCHGGRLAVVQDLGAG